MTITVFTSNQPRHTALIESLAGLAETVYAVQECNTVFPGEVPDFFRRSEVMQAYFRRVIDAETEVFGRPRFAPANAVQLPIKMGDLNRLELDTLAPALQSDVYVVFGASYIRGPLCEFLIARRTYNIHMGVSPYYRGSSTNFWALYDERPQYVGATLHLLTDGLDSGPMLCHALPAADAVDPFLLGMRAVRAAHAALVHHLANGELQTMPPVPQDKRRQLRYTRNADFTDAVAAEYLDRLAPPERVRAALDARNPADFLHPFIA
ncbi:MAG: methionyl-tRNA formyltransferase, partial [Phycisphaerae bacterium]|nr:methionyl-tRNA formyltransferase [Phycisphaerae bacterium]